MAEGEAEAESRTESGSDSGGGSRVAAAAAIEVPGAGSLERGVAAIKPQYLTTKEQFHAFLETKGKDAGGQGTEKPAGSDAEEEEPTCKGLPEPASKKIKLEEEKEETQGRGADEVEQQRKRRARGQNKNRPHVKPTHYSENKLCPSLIQASADKCFFGERCRFLHNLAGYMAAKPPDLGDRCVLFDTFGKCIYGVTCRFAGAHLGEQQQNLVDAERAAQWRDRQVVRNGLSKELQQQLRKKMVLFGRSERYLRQLNGPARGGAGKGRTPDPGAGEVGGGGGREGPAPAREDPSSGPPTSESQAGGPGEEPGAGGGGTVRTSGPLTDEDVIRLRPAEKKELDIRGKLYLAPLTTCGNLPFRRICKRFGADVTCGEMAVCTNLLQGQSSEWALLKRHHSEDLFGVQLEGAFPDTMTKCAELLNRTVEVDFVDINVGCPIDLVYKKGGGCALMNRSNKFEQIVRGMNSVLDVPLTVKIRTGVQEKANLAHRLLPELRAWGVSLVTLHGRSREQRYTKVADWQYIEHCAQVASPMPLFGNGDILSYEDANCALRTGVSGVMIARGALIKPWLFTEIKEQRHWDISSGERLEILRDFTRFGLEHWGSDTQGVEKTRRFLLEWLSFLCRYIPTGLLEHPPQKINERPPYYLGRDHLETLMASQHVDDWIRISEMLLGPVPPAFTFLPKHKANSYK
ncbi:tRNA-dihydrouridine(47) synthase [NAD(P)(+)]-like [Tachyglossus aculeatus]|uniref:tRNA-dihydrouridine(47) synthase [NAD(P)(+)]-like n=1 Tax=Tachyglossus aculeatus TaxID=9261 RepID=UPI0018F60189|nr:tRNA-dihydrouridine(47) synthase [NAD(P)(+)]-like [Tachyglossus aculeatus]